MKTAPAQPDSAARALLQDVAGYLNFSGGSPDPKFLRSFNCLYSMVEASGPADAAVVCRLCAWIEQCLDDLRKQSNAFEDVSQARGVVLLLRDHLMPHYREFHRDLLWHQSEAQLWQPLFLGRAIEAILCQGPPWDQAERITEGALSQLNDYIGYRPVAVLESEQRMEPYDHERVRPIPLYIKDAGVGRGQYEALIASTLEILRSTDEDLLRQAWFDLDMVDELSLDPRAYDFDHPVNRRPNYHFGQWDPHTIGGDGHYRRFVLQQIALDALAARIKETPTTQTSAGPGGAASQEERLFEAAAVLAGTMLMASGTSGSGPGCHSSDLTIAKLLAQIAKYRDEFYRRLLERVSGQHGERLRREARRTRQPFGGARQHLNQELARRRAAQLQHVHLAQLFARMGYPEAALHQARTVRVASARMLSHIYCSLTAGHHALDGRQLEKVTACLLEVEDLLQRGIECGALVDPWNVVGFAGNFSWFPALEGTVHDYRVDDLIDLMEQIFDLCSRAWTEAAAMDDDAHEDAFSETLSRLAHWWDKYATSSVSGVKRLIGKEIEVSTNLVAGALNSWKKAGAAAGDVAFWRMFVEQFDSPKSFQLVIEALLDKGDCVASMALMLQWVSQVDRTPLEDGDASFHLLALRWLRLVEAHEMEAIDEKKDNRKRETGHTGEAGHADEPTDGGEAWPLVTRFLARLEASSEAYWDVPSFELAGRSRASEAETSLSEEEADQLDDELDDEFHDDDEPDELYSAAYENVIYRDSTSDGFEGALLDEGGDESTYALEEEAHRLRRSLTFQRTVAQLWKHAAIAWGSSMSENSPRGEQFAQWHGEAMLHSRKLVALLDEVHRYRVAPPAASYESMVEYDRARSIKETLLEQIITTCVEMTDAGQFLQAAAGKTSSPIAAADAPTASQETSRLLRSLLTGDSDAVRNQWKEFTRALRSQELLVVPLSRGGSPARIVKARALSQLIYDLLGWLPRLGLIKQTCDLLEIALKMESDHPVGPNAVTDYDRLFANGFRALVGCLVDSAECWEQESGTEPQASTDELLVDMLQQLTEAQLRRWLAHSRTLRLSVVEKVAARSDWQQFVAFVREFGGDLFTQEFFNGSNLHAILDQRVTVWLSNLEELDEDDEPRLVRELGRTIDREDAVQWLTLIIEAVLENYREYREYNVMTTQSDDGSLLYTLIDFLRLRASYDRIAWNLRPVVMAHAVLVRKNRLAAAELWQRVLAERTTEEADKHLERLARLCEKYGMKLPTVGERLGERFTRPLVIDRIRALVGPAIEKADSDGDNAAFAGLEREIESLASEPAGAGLDVPDWLSALEDEVSELRLARRHHQPSGDIGQRIGQVRLSWEELQRQLGDERCG